MAYKIRIAGENRLCVGTKVSKTVIIDAESDDTCLCKCMNKKWPTSL